MSDKHLQRVTEYVSYIGQPVSPVYRKDQTAPLRLSLCHGVIARLMSLALQYGAPLETADDLFTWAKFVPCDYVVVRNHHESCTSLPNLISRHDERGAFEGITRRGQGRLSASSRPRAIL